jgi:hypothetical protein
MEKYNVGDKVLLKTGSGAVIEAEIIKYEKGYYELHSADSSFPLTLSEKTLEKIKYDIPGLMTLPQVA